MTRLSALALSMLVLLQLATLAVAWRGMTAATGAEAGADRARKAARAATDTAQRAYDEANAAAQSAAKVCQRLDPAGMPC